MTYTIVNKHLHLLYLIFFFAVLIFKELRGTVLTCLRQSNICNSIKKSTVQIVFIVFLLVLIFRSLGF